MKTTDIERLEQQIEHPIREYLADCTRCAMQAVEGGFSAAKRTAKRRVEAALGAVGQRRSAEEIDALAERLAAAVGANPDTTMVALAFEVGASCGTWSGPPSTSSRRGGSARWASETRRATSRYR